MIPELHGTFTLSNDRLVAFTAPLIEEVDDNGCMIYEVKLPLFFTDEGDILFMKNATVEVLPPKSTLRFTLDVHMEEHL